MKRLRDLLISLPAGLARRRVGRREMLAGLGAILLCLNVIELARSSDVQEGPAAALANANAEPAAAAPDLQDAPAILRQRNLFEPAVPLPSRRVAKQSVDRIVGMLSLNAILESGGRYVAYMQVKGFGMKRFGEGEGIEDLFRVLRIEPRRVELEVVGERVKLEL